MSTVTKRLAALEERSPTGPAHRVQIIDQNALSWTQEEEDRVCAEVAQYPRDGRIHLVIVEKVNMEKRDER